ncbi:zinc metalloprotease ZmpB [Colletotrichum spaethianum]|uniref:Zinc metalloprotease ZmpB n=1 Tax=Colletotrichum spaethianum TaxID=700344 RepID=A0AA37LGZ2_9PEZI|nr:zinc metalloprotease ZmpB [Colletotrichum spaethianum]GKT45775.1 zinc metalloprotease ZmpB [Colletotrichum spaethianum]
MTPKFTTASFHITRKQRLVATIAISAGFFLAELVIGFRTKSLALIADAFHYFSERKTSPRTLTFGWKRAQTLGAFFNGVFLLALGVSILLQAVERFSNLTHVEDPILMLIMGCVGLGLNVLVMSFLHGQQNYKYRDDCALTTLIENHHGHDEYETDQCEGESIEEPVAPGYTSLGSQTDSGPEEAEIKHRHGGRDLGMLGVMIHVIGDAINNAGVIVAAVVIWKGNGDGRFYADPGVSLFIAVTIMASAWPLCKRAGYILMESAPSDVDLDNVRSEITKISGVESVTELLVWRIDQKTTLATAHIVVADDSVSSFDAKVTAIGAGLRTYGIHSIALQPIYRPRKGSVTPDAGDRESASKVSEGVKSS